MFALVPSTVQVLSPAIVPIRCVRTGVTAVCRERADAVQQRLLKILSITTPPAPGVPASLHSSSSSAAAAAAAAAASRKGRSRSAGGFQVLTPALNTIFALYDHGYLPQVDLLQVSRQVAA